jgi:iron complex transport system ATP-binding protein
MIKAIDIDNLICSYNKSPVLKKVTFSVQKGDMFIVIGPNGSGKTTLMKAMAGISGFENGNVYVLGRVISSYSKRKLAQTVAIVPQEGPLDFPFTVNELVLMGRSPYLGILGLPSEEDFEIAARALAFTGVEHLAHRKLGQLSGGEKQLVFIARAICQEPQIIILDEPTASLDIGHQIKIMDLMEKLKLEKSVTVIMVSHDVNLAAMYGDTLLLLKDGEGVNLGTPEEVLTFKILEEAYGCTLLVDKSPLGRVPRVTPVPQKFMT